MKGKGDETVNKKDKQTLDMLAGEFEKSVGTARVPLKLQKESVVTMLKNSDGKEKDFSYKTGTRKNIVVLRRLTAAAAMLAIVIVATLYMKSGGVKVIKTDEFYKGYESVNPVKNAKSYEDVEKAVLAILGKQEKDEQASANRTQENNNSTSAVTQKVIDSLIEGYSKYISDGGDKSEYTAEAASAKADGVVSNGDFKADIVKNDGKYLYAVTTGTNPKTGGTVEQIKIISAVPAEKMNVASTVVLANGENASTVDECIEIYLKNNRLIALMSRYSYSMGGSGAYDKVSTVAVHYDITDPRAPVKLREHVQDGKYVSSELHGNSLCIVTTKAISENSKLDENGVIPSYSINGKTLKLSAEEIFIAVNDPEASYLFVTLTDIIKPDAAVGKLAVLGSGKEIYCSAKALAVTRGFVSVDEDENGKHSTLTEIYRFNTDGTKITFSGSYIVNGSLTGGVSVDDETGYLRVATQQAGASNFYILDEKMEFVSGLTGIFPNEKIKSVKFIGENACFVAGEDSEKTMIINISDPEKPVVAGNISTEGFSQALFEASDTLLLGFGEGGKNALNISLFDVSNPESPKTSSVYQLKGDFVLPSTEDVRSVMLDSSGSLFGIPIVKFNPTSETEISAYVLFSVADGVITPVGTFNHDTSYTGDAAVRGTCIDGILYTVSGQRVTAFEIDECTVISSIEIR